MLSTQLLKYDPLDCDPLVSDTACHTRAPYLVYLVRKSKSKKLNNEEKKYLETCAILTETQYRKRDLFGLIVDEKTNIHKIPEQYLPNNASNTKKNSFLAQKKSELAQSTINFLQSECRELILSQEFEELSFQISSYKFRIPVLPLYCSAKMMLHYAAKAAIPLIVNLKRLILEKEEFSMDGAVTLVYAFDVEIKKFKILDYEKDEAGIVLDMATCYVPGKENEVSNFLMSSTFKVFMELFVKEDLAFLVMLCAVGHAQVPPSAEPLKLSNENSVILQENSEFKAEETSDLTEILNFEKKAQDEKDNNKIQEIVSRESKQVDLNSCSTAEYQRLTQFARKYGFFRKDAQYARIDQKKQKLIRTRSCLPIFIDHIYASSIKKCKENTASILEKKSELRAPCEEKFSSAFLRRN